MSSPALRGYARAAVEAAEAAGQLLLKHLGRPKRVATKRSAIDLVTELDHASEQLIERRLRRAFPEVGFFGEERGARGAAGDTRWIVDPLDGTNNFVHGLPIFGVSIALERRRRVLVGVIDDPTRRERFVALRGGGAWLNGRRIRVSRTPRLAQSLLSTGFPSRFLTHDEPYLGWFQATQRHSHGVRRIGSTVVSLASVAAGRLEGFYERELWPWDIAAGALLVEEAGGRASNFEGNPVVLEEGRLVATNGLIHRHLLRLLKKVSDTFPASKGV